ncbi:hypothetical protein MASR1M66_02110 [Aminivibrio sp.]
MQRMRRLLGALLLCILLPAAAQAGDPVTRATAILERWTSFHWGRGHLVWIVHYPERGPWWRPRRPPGMSEAEK